MPEKVSLEQYRELVRTAPPSQHEKALRYLRVSLSTGGPGFLNSPSSIVENVTNKEEIRTQLEIVASLKLPQISAEAQDLLRKL